MTCPWLSATRPRPANKNHHNSYHDITVDFLIDLASRTSNSQDIRALVEPHDAKIIESILLSITRMGDRDGWHVTNNGKYTVKSAYQVEKQTAVFVWTHN